MKTVNFVVGVFAGLLGVSAQPASAARYVFVPASLFGTLAITRPAIPIDGDQGGAIELSVGASPPGRLRPDAIPAGGTIAGAPADDRRSTAMDSAVDHRIAIARAGRGDGDHSGIEADRRRIEHSAGAPPVCIGASDCGLMVSIAGAYLVSQQIVQVTLAAPEPTIWALMTIGLGLVGANMRRQARAVRRRPT